MGCWGYPACIGIGSGYCFGLDEELPMAMDDRRRASKQYQNGQAKVSGAKDYVAGPEPDVDRDKSKMATRVFVKEMRGFETR